MGILTESEEQTLFVDGGRHRISRVETELERFVKRRFSHPCDLALWMHAGAEFLLANPIYLSWDKGDLDDVGKLRAAVEEQIREAWQEQVDWHREDPEGYKRYFKQDAPTSHPWGVETLTSLRIWLYETTPYTIYRIHEAAMHAAMDEVTDRALLFVTEQDDGTAVKKAALERFEREMDEWVRRVVDRPASASA